MEKILQIKNLHIESTGEKPHHLVRGINLSVQKGKTLALVGENGSGKSLSSLAVMRLLPSGIRQSAGEIFFENKNLACLSEEEMRQLRNSRISLIMQNPMSAFDPIFTIRSHFIETLKSHEGWLSRAQINDRSKAALLEAGFTDKDNVLDIYPFQMSGGMLQRVMIALALLSSPTLLIADEATSDLDVHLQKQIIELLQKSQKKNRLSILLITHDFSVAAAMADDIAVMHRGQILEQGTINEIFERPSSDCTQEFLKTHLDLYEDSFFDFSSKKKRELQKDRI